MGVWWVQWHRRANATRRTWPLDELRRAYPQLHGAMGSLFYLVPGAPWAWVDATCRHFADDHAARLSCVHGAGHGFGLRALGIDGVEVARVATGYLPERGATCLLRRALAHAQTGAPTPFHFHVAAMGVYEAVFSVTLSDARAPTDSFSVCVGMPSAYNCFMQAFKWLALLLEGDTLFPHSRRWFARTAARCDAEVGDAEHRDGCVSALAHVAYNATHFARNATAVCRLFPAGHHVACARGLLFWRMYTTDMECTALRFHSPALRSVAVAQRACADTDAVHAAFDGHMYGRESWTYPALLVSPVFAYESGFGKGLEF